MFRPKYTRRQSGLWLPQRGLSLAAPMKFMPCEACCEEPFPCESDEDCHAAVYPNTIDLEIPDSWTNGTCNNCINIGGNTYTLTNNQDPASTNVICNPTGGAQDFVWWYVDTNYCSVSGNNMGLYIWVELDCAPDVCRLQSCIEIQADGTPPTLGESWYYKTAPTKQLDFTSDTVVIPFISEGGNSPFLCGDGYADSITVMPS